MFTGTLYGGGGWLTNIGGATTVRGAMKVGLAGGIIR